MWILEKIKSIFYKKNLNKQEKIIINTKEELRSLIILNNKKLSKNNYIEFCNSFNDNYDYSKIKYMSFLFKDCSDLYYIPELDLENVIDMTFAFENCSNLKK